MLENHAQNDKISSSCYIRVAPCPYCAHESKKYGFTTSGKQRFRCKTCFKTFIYHYTRQHLKNIDREIVLLLKEGCGIRSIGRILHISAVTVIRKIRIIADAILMPEINIRQSFQIDELYTFVGNKNNPKWVIYAINNVDKKVVAFHVGSRSNTDIAIVTKKLIGILPQRIYTDKLIQYKSLIPPDIHSTKQYGTNNIERKNLTLRTHLKRLNRKTICFSRITAMLQACLMIYFFS